MFHNSGTPCSCGAKAPTCVICKKPARFFVDLLEGIDVYCKSCYNSSEIEDQAYGAWVIGSNPLRSYNEFKTYLKQLDKCQEIKDRS